MARLPYVYAPSPLAEEFQYIQNRVNRLIETGMVSLCLNNAGVDKQINSAYLSDDDLPNQEKGFKEIKTYLFKKYALKQMRKGMLISGEIYDKGSDYFTVRILKVWSLDSDELHLDNLGSLDIFATLMFTQLESNPKETPVTPGRYSIGDKLTGRLTKIDIHSDVIFLSMKDVVTANETMDPARSAEEEHQHRSNKRKRVWTSADDKIREPKFYKCESVADENSYDPSPFVQSGIISPNYRVTSPRLLPNNNKLFAPSPLYYPSASLYAPSPVYNVAPTSPSAMPQKTRMSAPTDPRTMRQTERFTERVLKNPMFRNPKGITLMKHAYGMKDYTSLMRKPKIIDAQKYTVLREDQTNKFANQSLQMGIQHAKQGGFDKALKCYEKCLEITPQNTDCMVAMGAAYAKQGKYDDAESIIKQAMKINKNTRNAAEYLTKIRSLKQSH